MSSESVNYSMTVTLHLRLLSPKFYGPSVIRSPRLGVPDTPRTFQMADAAIKDENKDTGRNANAVVREFRRGVARTPRAGPGGSTASCQIDAVQLETKRNLEAHACLDEGKEVTQRAADLKTCRCQCGCLAAMPGVNSSKRCNTEH